MCNYFLDHKLEYNNLDTMRLLYLRKCDAFGVAPCGNFLRHLESKTMDLKNQHLGPSGIRAVVTPLPVSRGTVETMLPVSFYNIATDNFHLDVSANTIVSL